MRLLALFKDVVDMAVDGTELPRTPQGEGRYVTREEFEAMRKVPPGEDPGDAGAADRAFWYPPYDGATMEVAGDGQPGRRGAAGRDRRGEREAGRFP